MSALQTRETNYDVIGQYMEYQFNEAAIVTRGEDLSTSRTEEGVIGGVVSLLALIAIGTIGWSRCLCCRY